MSLQSDISSFFDQITLNEVSEEVLQDTDPLQSYQAIDMYEVLLKQDLNQNQNHKLPNERLYLLQTKYNSAPLSTINPRKLNAPSTLLTSSSSSNSSSTHITTSSSDLDSNPIIEDYQSVSSIDESEEDKPVSRETRTSNNWSMNDEFKNAIQEWLSQNEIRSKRNSVSENSRPNFQRTSITKRRKSESSVAFHNSMASNPYLQTLRNSKPKTKSSSISSSSIITDSKTKSTTPTLIPSSPSETPTAQQSQSQASLPNSQPQSQSHSHAHAQSHSHSHSHSISTSQSSETPEEEKPFKCEDCPKAFRRSEHLKRHIRSVHSNIRPFPCKYCEKKFSRSDNLAQHLRTHNRH